MTEPPDALHLLRSEEDSTLSPEAEILRRQRVVRRIEHVRARLSAEQTASPSVAPLLEQGSRAHRDHANSALSNRFAAPSRWRLLAAALASLAVLIVIPLFLVEQRSTRHAEPLVRVTSGQVVLGVDSTSVLTRDETWDQGNDVVVSTTNQEATVLLSNDAALSFGLETRAHIERSAVRDPDGSRDAERVRVAYGNVEIKTSRRAPDESVRVVTKHVEIMARGASFAVLVDRHLADEQTRVVVRDGELQLWSEGQEQRVLAGQTWVSKSQLAEAPRIGEQNDKSGVTPMPEAAATTTARVTPKPSSLAKQNELFESAQAARRQGNPSLALQRFETLMRTFPGSEQAHNARVEHFRLLRSLGRHAEAKKSAHSYLRAHPRGFAAAEAERLTQ